jgi:hypothetical protein
MNNESVPARRATETLGPDGQPVPALAETPRSAPNAMAQRPAAKPGDVPADGTMSADSDTGPQISERPMPAASDTSSGQPSGSTGVPSPSRSHA